MYGAVRISAIAGSSTIFAKGAHGMYHFNTTSDKYQKDSESMIIHTSETFKDGRIKETSSLNQTIMRSGMKELISVSECYNLFPFQIYRNTNQPGFTSTLASAKFTDSLFQGSIRSMIEATFIMRSREKFALTWHIEHLKIRQIIKKRSLFVSMEYQAPAKTLISQS